MASQRRPSPDPGLAVVQQRQEVRRRRRHQRAELFAVEALIGDLMRDDEMGLGIDSTLHIVADQAAVPRAGCHRAGVGVGQGDLAIRSVSKGLVHLLEPRDLLPDAAIAA